MIAGQIKFGVLHLDDVPVLDQELKRPLTVIASFKEVNPLSHYLAIVCTTDRLNQKRDAYVRALEGLVDGPRYTLDPNNAQGLAPLATDTGLPPKSAT